MKGGSFTGSATDSFSKALHLDPTRVFDCASKNNYDFIPDFFENFDLSTQPWALLNEDEMARLFHQASSFDPGAPTDLGCMCDGSYCVCKPEKGLQLPGATNVARIYS